MARAVAVGTLLATSIGASAQPGTQLTPESHARGVKVLIISMLAPEARPWINKLGLTQGVPVPDLSIDYPNVHRSVSDVYQLTTGMGKANTVSSISALIYSDKFDLQHTYFLVTDITGIDPSQGTFDSATWARFLVDSDVTWEIDTRGVPASRSDGFIGINTQGPGQKPPLDYKTEVFHVDEVLLQKALALSKSVVLDDNAITRAYRADYPSASTNQPPSVAQCDTVASSTYWRGAELDERKAVWIKLLADGQDTYCTTQQKDNATFEAFTCSARAGLLDLQWVAVLRTASNFDRPCPGQTPYDLLVNSNSGGFVPSFSNLYLAGGPLVDEVVTHWSVWKHGVPSP